MPENISQSKKADDSTNNNFQIVPVSAIALIHFIHDIYTSFLAPILPELIKRMGLSITEAGSLAVFLQAPSILNPFLGALADKKKLNRLFLTISPAITATLMCTIGFADHYIILAMILLCTGISIAIIHVSAPVMVAKLSGKSVGRGMGFFMLGGELARTAGPLVAVWALSSFGLEGLWKLMPVGILASIIIWLKMRKLPPQTSNKETPSIKAMLKQMKVLIAGVFGILVARAFMASAITTYLPVYLVDEGHSLWMAGISLAIFELCGAVGVFISGSLSDYMGRKKLLAITIIIAPLLMLALLFSKGLLLYLILGALGFFLLASGPIMMAMILENAGENPAAANGMFMAISFAVRASIILVVGALSDHYGLHTAFMVCAFMGFVSLPFLFIVPKTS